MWLRDQGIDNNDGGVGRERRAQGLRNDDRGVGGRRGIDGVSKGLETTTEAVRIWGQLRRLQRCDDGLE